MRYDEKEKGHSSSLLKAFQIRLFLNTSIFKFIHGHFKPKSINCYCFVRVLVTVRVRETLCDIYIM